MDWLNYHHLLYFWTVARTGSVTAASMELRLAPATVSAQIHELEKSLGEQLLRRSGRKLALTEAGEQVFRYASSIFSLGREMLDALHNHTETSLLRLAIGVADVVPALIAEWLIQPALQISEPVRILCREAAQEELLAKLAIQEIDVMLADTPMVAGHHVRAYNHLLGECGVILVASSELARRHKRHFPQCLDGAPMLLPTDNTSVRRGLEQWFKSLHIRPEIVGEFEDYSLLRAFGEAGLGIMPAPAVLERRVERLFKMKKVGETDAVHYRFFMISAEKKISHPAIAAMLNSARRDIFGRAAQLSRSASAS